MKTTMKRVLAVVLALSALVLCFASCGSSVTKLKVKVAIYGLTSGGEKELWIRNNEMEIEEGKTADDAVVALCEARSVTYVKDQSGMFDSFKNSEGELKVPETKALDNGTSEYYHFGWSLNGEIQSNIDNNKKLADHVLADGDSIEIFIQKDVVKAE